MASTEVAKPRGKAAAKTTPSPAPTPTPGFSYITAGLQERADYIARLAPSTILPTAYRGNAANAFVAAETGAALGLEPLQALASIAVINGRATLSSDLMAAVIRRAGHTLRIVENSPESVTATLIRADDKTFKFEVTWDKDKAVKAGLWGQKGPWSQYPTQMLRARAITEVARQGASEALMGMIYSPEDFGATMTETGEVIEAEIVAEAPTPAKPNPKPAAKPAAAPSQPATLGKPLTPAQANALADFVASTCVSSREAVERLQAMQDAVAKAVEDIDYLVICLYDNPRQAARAQNIRDDLAALINEGTGLVDAAFSARISEEDRA